MTRSSRYGWSAARQDAFSDQVIPECKAALAAEIQKLVNSQGFYEPLLIGIRSRTMPRIRSDPARTPVADADGFRHGDQSDCGDDADDHFDGVELADPAFADRADDDPADVSAADPDQYGRQDADPLTNGQYQPSDDPDQDGVRGGPQPDPYPSCDACGRYLLTGEHALGGTLKPLTDGGDNPIEPCRCRWPLAALDEDDTWRCVKCARPLAPSDVAAPHELPPPA